MSKCEVDIAALIISWLEEQEWETYKEVQISSYGRRADIVGVKGKLIWVVETKTTLTFEVIAQALGWKGYAHFISIGIPELTTKRSNGRMLAERFIGDCGLGILTVGKNWVNTKSPNLHRDTFMIDHMRDSLHPKCKESVAGNAHGHYHTPWRETCERLAKVVSANPGITMTEAVKMLKHHHYCSDATAISSLHQWLRLGKIKGIKRRKEGKQLKLYPDHEGGKR